MRVLLTPTIGRSISMVRRPPWSRKDLDLCGPAGRHRLRSGPGGQLDPHGDVATGRGEVGQAAVDHPEPDQPAPAPVGRGRRGPPRPWRWAASTRADRPWSGTYGPHRSHPATQRAAADPTSPGPSGPTASGSGAATPRTPARPGSRPGHVATCSSKRRVNRADALAVVAAATGALVTGTGSTARVTREAGQERGQRDECDEVLRRAAESGGEGQRSRHVTKGSRQHTGRSH